MYKCKHFTIKELVSPQVYNKFGEFAWKFFDENLLRDLDTIREYHGPITINNWPYGGKNTQCGLRTNVDPLVKNKKTLYCSAHLMGKAFDLHSSDNRKLYKDIQDLFNDHELLAITRMESSESTKYGWCHVDSFQPNDPLKLEIFKA